MKGLLLPLLTCMLAAPAAAQTDLRCPDIKPRARTIKISRTAPVRRGKAWLPGAPRTTLCYVCDLYGLKTEEAEYDGKTLSQRTSLVYKDKEASAALCEELKSEAKRTTTFSQEGKSSLDEFCRRNRKKDYRAVQVYDASPSQGKESERKPVRTIFRLLDSRGLAVEEQSFDPQLALETVTLRKFAKDGSPSEETVNDFDGRQLRRLAFARDAATASATESYFGENNELRRKTVREYRDDGTLRREVITDYDSGEQPVTRTEIYCDVKGRRVNELVYDMDSSDPKYAYDYFYVYDKKDNWTEERKTRVIMFNGERLEDTKAAPGITVRELSYY